MGLIKAAKDALESLVADQWREYFYCSSLASDVLVAKGEKQVTKGRNSNTKGVDNIISNGSIISVNAGQCMIIVDNGKIAEFCAEPGEFLYDTSTEPSLLYGALGENVTKSFQQFGKRFTFGGNAAKDQRVYYFNIKEIMNNLYGTPNPIRFHYVSSNTGFELETSVKCNGQYTFKIVDPILFYTNVCGNVEHEYRKTELLSVMKAELLTKLPVALAKIAAQGVLPYQVPMHLEEVTTYLKEELTEDWTLLRGIEVVSMTMSDPIVPQADVDKINKWNETAVLRNDEMKGARQMEAYASMLENMANGSNGKGGTDAMGAAMNMMAMNMMQQNMGMGVPFGMQYQNAGGQPAKEVPKMQPASTVEEGAVLGWTCSCGEADNRGKFCHECGLPKPALEGWTCSCGTVNQGKFCYECGKRKPEGAPMYRCDKCGWEPENPAEPPKFCPECGDVFDEADIK